MATRNAAGPRTLMLGVAAIALLGAGYGLAKLTTKPAPPPEAAAAPEAAPTEVKVEASYLKVSNIALQTVTAGDFGGQVQGSGSVVATPGGEAVLTAHAGGTVVRIFKRLGEPVRAGETIALVESRDAALVAGQRGAADARAVLATSNLAREKKLFEQGVTSRQDYETAKAQADAARAEAAGARAAAGASRVSADGRSVAVVSPISGRITAAPATLGAFVQSESELFRVADARDVQVEVAVSPQDAARIVPGATASVRNAAGQTIAATVRSVTPTLNPETRTATVVLSVSGGGLVPGEAIQATITARGTGQPGFILPEEAVQSMEGRDVVFVRTATGFSVRPVVVATRSGGQALIVSGLKAGETVAARNAFLLKAEIVKGADAE
ncbi:MULTISPECIES: efflux RND transporter periplasmic adaptor subunit [Caulobacter]|jgi:cobalt-zinc-cadmium efflux system membrane fusion protein|uniref:RND family efflux transporter, MFP subunit n=1 Tax=Caulobacter vibrioides OR37 TaxID=1292034 RepID=R0EPA2_CAUVI|nr:MULTISPECIES: efflux RND transporter periplasmic adaptor subunit [Caulobacter]ENZ82887.1 RND family efflux transporter, MFP subunit [Caulobacter vibrioides OR37]PIB96885.1 efflux RND transporter periplasmic adaptor subunit [Caulobacter sp. X]